MYVLFIKAQVLALATVATGFKAKVLYALSIVASLCGALLGGWDDAMKTLFLFMAADYLTGLMVAAVFKNSPKSKNKGLKSGVGFKGLCKKVIILLLVAAMHRVDIMLGTNGMFRTGAAVAFCANELVSLVENAGLMGIPIPKKVKEAIDIFNDKADGDDAA